MSLNFTTSDAVNVPIIVLIVTLSCVFVGMHPGGNTDSLMKDFLDPVSNSTLSTPRLFSAPMVSQIIIVAGVSRLGFLHLGLGIAM